MNPITRIRNINFLHNVTKDKVEVKNQHAFDCTCFSIFGNYKSFKKGGLERNLGAASLWKLRKKFPYQIKGWGDCQKKYNEYFKMNGAINSVEEAIDKFKKNVELFVTMYTGSSYYQVGDNPFHYSECSTMIDPPIIFKADGVSRNDDKPYISTRIELETIRNNIRIGQNLDEQWLTAFRYSTKEEIDNFKREKARKEKVQLKIDEKKEELNKLYKEYNNE